MRAVIKIVAIWTVALICLGGSSVAAEHQAVVSFDPNRTIGVLSPELLGTNLQWTDRGDGLLASGDPTGRLTDLSLIKRLPLPVIRFPGGAMSSTYRWSQGVGRAGKRGTGLDFVGAPQPMLFGTDEYMALLRATGAKGIITLNPKAGPAEAAQWLAYVRRAGAAVPYWEVGNESFLPQDPSYMKARDYVAVFDSFQRALKQEDPKVKVFAILEASLIGVSWGRVIVPEIDAWNTTVIKGTARTADYYSVHFYPLLKPASTERETMRAVAVAPLVFSRNAARIQRQVKQAGSRARLWLTEFNLLMDSATHTWKFGTTYGQAGYVAGMILAAVRLGLAGANYWSLVGNHNFGIAANARAPRLRPAGLVYAMLAPLAGGRAVFTEVQSELLRYSPIGNVGPGLKPKVLDAQVFVRDGRFCLVLINRSPDQAVTVRLQGPNGWQQPSVFQRSLLQAESVMSTNDAREDVRVIRGKASFPMTLQPGAVAVLQAAMTGQ